MKQREEKKLTVLVTGGAGFIGSHLTDELLHRTYQVRVLDNLCNGSLENLSHAAHHANFQFIHGDILHKETCLQATQDIDVVYHLACLGVRHSIHSPFENHRVNAEGTLNVLEAVKKNRVKKFFYISTSEIYGGTQSFPIREEHLPVPFTVYGASKLAGELYTNAFHTCYGLNSSILRIFNNYGPRAHYEGDAGELIPRTIVNLLYDTPPVIFGDGMMTRDFFYVKDTARALSDLLPLADELNGTTMNIGTGVEYSITSIVEKIVTFMKKQDVGIRFVEARPADVPRLWVDAARFYDATGFQPAYSFEEGLRETIDYYTRLAQDKNLASQIIVKNWEITNHDSNSETASY
ncbi:MAG: GDP-mannose 4,6-dehydratase [Lentisphaerae bacterium]|nr:GDP-mannose 4,6-dehydratase [Lentisphaerota bacterium]